METRKLSDLLNQSCLMKKMARIDHLFSAIESPNRTKWNIVE